MIWQPTSEKLDEWYNKNHYWYLYSIEFKKMYELIGNMIGALTWDSLLDVGCWDGILLDSLDLDDVINTYTGFDLSNVAIERARKFKEEDHIKFEIGNWNDPPVQGQFDVIYMGGVLYYIEDKKTFIQKYIDKYNPKHIIIQDLQMTDLSEIENLGESGYSFWGTFPKEGLNEERTKRQIIRLDL